MSKYIGPSIILGLIIVGLVLIFKEPVVRIGETWVRNPPKNPFEKPSAVDTRTVIAVSNNYVQYTWKDGRYTDSCSKLVFVWDSKKVLN